MRIIIFGAKGDVGSRVVGEALSRGHDVTAVVRQEGQATGLPKTATIRTADARDTEAIATLLDAQDFAVCALRPPAGRENELAALTQSVINATDRKQVPLLIVGGAASLNIPEANGHTVLTAPGFLPPSTLPIARASFAQYQVFAESAHAGQTYLCPPAMLMPGERTGRYRTGASELLVDSNGVSQISMEDFAVALLDEAENPKHSGERFTVAN